MEQDCQQLQNCTALTLSSAMLSTRNGRLMNSRLAFLLLQASSKNVSVCTVLARASPRFCWFCTYTHAHTHTHTHTQTHCQDPCIYAPVCLSKSFVFHLLRPPWLSLISRLESLNGLLSLLRVLSSPSCHLSSALVVVFRLVFYIYVAPFFLSSSDHITLFKS